MSMYIYRRTEEAWRSAQKTCAEEATEMAAIYIQKWINMFLNKNQGVHIKPTA